MESQAATVTPGTVPSPQAQPPQGPGFFARVGNAITSIFDSINGFLAQNPVIKNVATGALHTVEISAISYALDRLAPGNTQAITAAGLSAVVLANVKVYAQHQTDKLLTSLQSQIVASQVAPDPSPSATVVVPSKIGGQS